MAMPDLDPSTLFAGLVFSTLGGAAWIYGKKKQVVKPMVVGAALVGVPFVLDGVALWATGIVLSVLVFWR